MDTATDLQPMCAAIVAESPPLLPAANRPPSVYKDLLLLNQWAFAVGNLNIALHALAAAMHCASELRDDLRLAVVQRLFEEQADVLHAEAPNFLKSPWSSRMHADEGAFRLGARTAAGLRERLKIGG